MCESQSLEATIMQLRKDNRELRSEREGLLMKNKLLADVLGDSAQSNGRPASQKSIDHQAIGASMGSLVGGDIKRAEREMADLREQVDQLRDAIERVRSQNEALEAEKADILEDIEKAAEKELALEDQLVAETEEKNDILKELEDFKESLRALCPSSQNQSDLQGYLENIERRESDLAERERYLDRREKLMEDRLGSLNNREAEIRHREVNLERKDEDHLSLKKLEKKNSRDQGSTPNYEVKGHEDYEAFDQGSVRNRVSRRHPTEIHDTHKALQDSIGSGYDSHYERAKEVARRKKEMLQDSMAASKMMRASESLSNMPSNNQNFPENKIKLSNTIGRSNTEEEMAPSKWTKKSNSTHTEQPRQLHNHGELKDSNKLTFNPSQMTDNGEMLIVDRSMDGDQAFPPSKSINASRKLDDSSDYRGMQESRYSQANKADVPRSSMFDNNHDDDGRSYPAANKWRKKAEIDTPKADADFVFDNVDNDDEMSESQKAKHEGGLSFDAGYQRDLSQLQDNTIMESRVQQSAINDEDTASPQPEIKKAVAFDLFDESIDEKKRQLLIQKLEKNRAQDKQQVHKNNFLAEKREQKSSRDRSKGDNKSGASFANDRSHAKQNQSKLGSALAENPSISSKPMNRESSFGRDNDQDDSFQKRGIQGSGSHARRTPTDKGNIQTSPFAHHKKYI